MDADPETVVTLQTVHGTAMRLDVGKSAVQCVTARASAPLWVRDLYECAAVMVALALSGTVLMAYGAVAVDSSVSAFIPAQVGLFVMAALWAWCAWQRASRALTATLFLSVTCVAIGATGVILWTTAWKHVYAESHWFWWVMLWIGIAEVLTTLGASKCTASLRSNVLTVHAHITLFRETARNTDGQFTRGDLGGTTADEPRLGSGSVAIAATRLAASSAEPSPGKKID